jgi:hypothetical protein
VRGRGGAVRHQAQGLVVFGIGLVLTSGSLAALNAATSHPAHSTELAVLVAANLAATVLRFLLFRAWVFPDRRDQQQTIAPTDAAPADAVSAYASWTGSPSSYATSSYATTRPHPGTSTTTGTGAGPTAQPQPGDDTARLRPVRPLGTDPRDPR